MALLYLDTSALVKLYIQEPGTERMLELAHPDARNQLAILSLARIEFRAAVRRRAKLGDIDADVADQLIRGFTDHLGSMFQIQPINEVVLEEAAQLIDRYTLRAYDALQLAGCLALLSIVGEEVGVQFVSADATLCKAADDEGFGVVNPANPAG